MREGLLGAVVGVAIAAAATMWSCTVDRPSQSLKCLGHADCQPGRICEASYCVVGMLPPDARELDAAVCPDTCNGGCDFATTTCTITGTGAGNISCPTAWNCNIGCSTPGACGTIDCSNAASCDIDCTADNACLGVTCATKNCDVTCSGSAACGDISCTSGNCTSSCGGGDGNPVCGSQSCTTGACTRTCTGSGACGAMTCSGGACTQTCSGGADACGGITCGSGKCTVACQGLEPSCGPVSCASSCQCDVACNSATDDTCPTTMTCPDPPGSSICWVQATGRCDSSVNANQCRKCS